MKLSFPSLLAFTLALAVAPAATPATAPSAPAPAVNASLTRELGRGLVYQRILALPGDLPNPEAARKRPTVLDVRYVHGDAAAGMALVAWLKFHAALHTPMFVLANTETDTAILQALATRGAAGSIIVIGAPARDFAPDIAVQTAPEMERKAYDALGAGVDPNTLMTENPDKERNDEASLSHDHSTEPEANKERPPAPPIDAALQRAVHLHRTLIALRKI